MAKAAAKKGTVLLLKAPKDSDEDRFVETLEQAGHRAILVPVLAFNFINQEKLAQALQNAHRFSGIILTSPRAVQAVTKALSLLDGGSKPFDPCSLRCFVIGQATANAAKEAKFHPEGMDTGNAEKLSQFILDSGCKEERQPLLYPCAQMRCDTLLDTLQSNGCCVEEIVAYETVPSESIMRDITHVFTGEDPPESVVYFSPSGVQFTEASVEQGLLPLKSLKVYALGPSTKQAIVSRGYPLTGVAARPDPASLLQVLQQS